MKKLLMEWYGTQDRQLDPQLTRIPRPMHPHQAMESLPRRTGSQGSSTGAIIFPQAMESLPRRTGSQGSSTAGRKSSRNAAFLSTDLLVAVVTSLRTTTMMKTTVFLLLPSFSFFFALLSVVGLGLETKPSWASSSLFSLSSLVVNF